MSGAAEYIMDIEGRMGDTTKVLADDGSIVVNLMTAALESRGLHAHSYQTDISMVEAPVPLAS